MIKINLLPYQKASKVKRQQVMEAQYILAGGVLLVLTVGLGFLWWSLDANITEQQTTRAST